MKYVKEKDAKAIIAVSGAHNNRHGWGDQQWEMYGQRGAFIPNAREGAIFEYDLSQMLSLRLVEALAEFDYKCVLWDGRGVVNDVDAINTMHTTRGLSTFDMAITIHFDSYAVKNSNRMRVFCGSAGAFAKRIAESAISGGIYTQPARAVKHGEGGYNNYMYIRETKMPAIIVEAFNGKDPKTMALFKDGLNSKAAKKWQHDFVTGLVAGIKEYYE